MSGEHNSSQRLAPMALAALGVVFGDIGTSPLYAVSACFVGPGIAVTPDHVLGVLSLIFWSLVLVILLKYVAVVLNADNKGEGGVLALTALVINTARASPRRKLYGTLGHSRRFAVFRGWRHHAGDIGIERRRRPACRGARRADSGTAHHLGGAGRVCSSSNGMARDRSEKYSVR